MQCVQVCSATFFPTIHTCMHAYTHDAFLQISNYVEAMAHLINPCFTMLYMSPYTFGMILRIALRNVYRLWTTMDDVDFLSRVLVAGGDKKLKSVRSLHVHVMLWSLVRLWRRSAARLQRIVKSDNSVIKLSIKIFSIIFHFVLGLIYELNIIILNEFCRTITTWIEQDCAVDNESLCTFCDRWLPLEGQPTWWVCHSKCTVTPRSLNCIAVGDVCISWQSKVGNVVEVACHDYKRRKWKTIPWKPQFPRTFWGLCWALPEIWAGPQLPNVY